MDPLQLRSLMVCARSAELREAGKRLRQQSRFALRRSDVRFSRSADLLTISRFQRHQLSARLTHY
jgi:hypothetical protein